MGSFCQVVEVEVFERKYWVLFMNSVDNSQDINPMAGIYKKSEASWYTNVSLWCICNDLNRPRKKQGKTSRN